MMTPSSEHTWNIRIGYDKVAELRCKDCGRTPTEAAKSWPKCGSKKGKEEA